MPQQVKNEENQESKPDKHQHLSPSNTELSVAPATNPAVEEQSTIVGGEQAAEQDGGNLEKDGGFKLEKVYSRDEIAQVKDFPVDSVQGTWQRRVGCHTPTLVTPWLTERKQVGKRGLEEIWLDWMPLYLIPDALALLKQRYGPVRRKAAQIVHVYPSGFELNLVTSNLPAGLQERPSPIQVDATEKK